MAPILGNLSATLELLDHELKACKNVDLIVLPELCNSGYRFRNQNEAFSSAEPATEAARFISLLMNWCRSNDAHIVTGFNELEKDRIYNSAVLIGPNGVEGKYRKLHLFMDEKDFFTPGDLGLPVFKIGNVKIGMLVCFDWIFPEAWRSLALDGADIICHPANLVIPGLAQKAVPIHALINHVFVITCNRIGTERDLTFTGMSLVAGPKGDVLASAPQDSPHRMILDIDPNLARDKSITPRNHIFTDRRPEFYSRLVQKSDL